MRRNSVVVKLMMRYCKSTDYCSW